MATALINGGFNGYTDRLKYFKTAVSVLKAEHLSSKMTDGVFLFEDSEIYNYRVYAYSWGVIMILFRLELLGLVKIKQKHLKPIEGR